MRAHVLEIEVAMRLLAIAAGFAVFAAGFITAPAQASDYAQSLSAKKVHKRHVVRRARPEAQVACTAFGCQRIPPGCTPTAGYDWRGIPTGFDVVVCR
jgi:hypothetical protein